MIDRVRAIALAIFVVSCGGGASTVPARPAHHAPASTSWEDRHMTMTFVVLPNMGRLWQEFTKSDAPTLTCRTCHGKDAEDVKYRMPNPSLPPLDPKNLPSSSSRDANEAKWAAFMRDEVVPRMTSMLDAAPHDPKTETGFWCFNCHTRKRP